MGRRPGWWHILQSSKREAILAVELHNRPHGERNLEGHVVHMHLAWLYLLHAKFKKEGTDYRYRDDRRRFIRTKDGDTKTWELGQCVRHWLPNESSPVRKNIEFFIGLRNKIEHQPQDVIEAVVSGRIQSNALNYEELLVATFGDGEGLGRQLRLPIFLSTLTGDASAAIKRAQSLLPRSVRSFIDAFDDGLDQDVLDHPRFDLRIYLVPKVGPKSEADAALEFVRLEDLTEDQRAVVRDMQQVIVREKQVPILLKDYLKPAAVAASVEAAIPFRFSASTHHSRCWRHFDVRPARGTTKPERTDARYCIYSEPYREYVYTPAWVRKLIAALGTRDAFKAVTGCEPVLKPAVDRIV